MKPTKAQIAAAIMRRVEQVCRLIEQGKCGRPTRDGNPCRARAQAIGSPCAHHTATAGQTHAGKQ